jgi:protein-tyrosine phosphatase
MTEHNLILPQSIGLVGVRNARELGGYKTQDGKTICKGRLLRTGKLAKANPEDLRKLTNIFAMGKVIDFRTSLERNREPDPQIEKVENLHLNVFGDDDRKGLMLGFIYAKSNPLEQMMEMEQPLVALHEDHLQVYRGFVTGDTALQAYRGFFRAALEQKEGAFSWHCQAGKDRAGVGSALMLLALGVDWDTIVQDYMLTNDYYQDSIEGFVEFVKGLSPREEIWKTARAMAGVNPAWMRAVEEEIQQKYGSDEVFLRDGLGLSPSDLQELRQRYLK